MKALVLIAVVIYVLRECCQPQSLIAPKCMANADLMDQVCCVFPPFFTQKVAKECGALISSKFYDAKNNVSGFIRRTADCDHWLCVLSKYNLLNLNAYLDLDKYFAHLDVWVSLNPSYAESMVEAKLFCRDEFRDILPLHTCKVFNFQSCIRNYLRVECPIYIQTPECNAKKEFLRECKQYFYK